MGVRVGHIIPSISRTACRRATTYSWKCHWAFVFGVSSNCSRRSYHGAVEGTNVAHSRFLSEASSTTKWTEGSESYKDGLEPLPDDFENITEGKGKLVPTSSHLFKLILPLGHLSSSTNTRIDPNPNQKDIKHPPPTVILLHPSQPLSHVSRLILGSLTPATPTISFRSTSSTGQEFQWSNSTDVGSFIRDAARVSKFSICISHDSPPLPTTRASLAAKTPIELPDKAHTKDNGSESVIDVEIPTFADRTRFLRRRLYVIDQELKAMEELKQKCDYDALRGARRMALGGFGMLVTYWAGVARLTFWDYGWDVMEPVTYLSGLSTVVCGYLWFLYQGREVSYSSILNSSISKRREGLYKSRGLDIERWADLMSEARGLRKEIGMIAEDYDPTRKVAQEDKAERDEEKEKQKDRDSGLSMVEDADKDLESDTDTDVDTHRASKN